MFSFPVGGPAYQAGARLCAGRRGIRTRLVDPRPAAGDDDPFTGRSVGKPRAMTDEQRRAERHPADEPDGTPAYDTSLRQPGESVVTGDEEPEITEESGSADRGGYDTGAVSGDTGVYRPD